MNELLSTSKPSQILDAAQKRFAHYGLFKVTMDEIAGDLGISKAALYYYFKTKEEIFRGVIAREQEAYLDAARLILENEGNASQKLRDYCLKRLQLSHELANLKIVRNTSWYDVKPILGDLLKSFNDQEHAFLVRILALGKKNHEFEVRSSDKTADLILNVLRGIGHRIHAPRTDQLDEQNFFEKICEETELLIELLLRGLTVRS